MKILLFLVAFLALGSTNAEPVIDGLLGGLLGGGGGGGLLGGLLGPRGILGGLLGGGAGGGLLGGLLGPRGILGGLVALVNTLLRLLGQILNFIDQDKLAVLPENAK